MKDFIKRNFAVLLAFLLPVLLIIIVVLTTYLPSIFLKTKYNFIYTVCVENNNYYPYNCNDFLQKKYFVENGKLVIRAIDPEQDLNNNKIPDIKENYTARIFLHDTEKNESREISLEEAQALNLSGLLTSQDGVSVSWDSVYHGGCDFFIFGGCGGSSYGYSLVKGKSHSKLNLINNNDRYYYQNNFQFLGWVLPGRN